MALRTVEDVFSDYFARRTAIIRALTTEVDQFCELFDPDEENLCLYGYPDESWEVTKPPGLLPTNLPEPAPGINFSRDVMQQESWLTLIAAHSDSWLISLAFLLGARAGLTQNERNHLFSLINDLPTILEVVISAQDTPSMDGGSESEGSSSTKRSINGQMEIDLSIADYGHEDAEDEHAADDSHEDAEDEHAEDDSHGNAADDRHGDDRHKDAEDEHAADDSHEDAEDEHAAYDIHGDAADDRHEDAEDERAEYDRHEDAEDELAADDIHEGAEDEQSVALCGGCGGKYDWIFCGVCKRWFHVMCARMIACGEDNNEYKSQFSSNEG